MYLNQLSPCRENAQETGQGMGVCTGYLLVYLGAKK